MINKIKEEIFNNKGQLLHFKYNGARNQIEEFDGIINGVYNYLFTIKVISERDEIKSFTYSDILINNLEIIKKRSC